MGSGQSRIVIFTGSTCPWCNRVKQYLNEKGFRFREVNVERNRDGARELQHRHIMGVPVALTGSYPTIGFNKAKIDKLPGIKR